MMTNPGPCAFGASVVAVALCGCGGVEVKGVVRDVSTQRPIAGATVRVGDETTRTDRDGFYSLEVRPRTDNERFRIEAPGYEPRTDVRLVDEDLGLPTIDFDLVAEPGGTPWRAGEAQEQDALPRP